MRVLGALGAVRGYKKHGESSRVVMASSARADLRSWLGAPRMGRPVTGFLPLKAPLDLAAHQEDFDEEHEFNVSMFMERQMGDGHSVGLVVDLTTPQPDGTPLYDTEEWARDWDVEYLSLPCAPPLVDKYDGQATKWVEPIPSEETVNAFIAAVGRFWAQPQNKRRYVAVHCITGINITGAMIVRFLMRTASVGPVLAAFSRSRPPGIYSPDILEAVWRASLAANPMQRGSKPSDGGWVQPQPPSWHPLPYRAVDRTSALPPSLSMPPPPTAATSKPAVPVFETSSASASTQLGPPSGAPAAFKRPAQPPDLSQMPPPKRPANNVATSAEQQAAPLAMKSVGTRLDAVESKRLRAQCMALVALPGAADNQLPCHTHGAPVRTAHLEGMRAAADNWLVTWKAAGERCLLMVTAAGVAGPTASILLDKHGGAYRLPPMAWPKAQPPPGGTEDTHSAMVIAGEVVCDSDGASSKPVWRLLCYDLLALGGKSLATMPLSKRMALLGQEVLTPRKAPTHAAAVAAELLRVRQKDCFRLKHVAHLMKKFIPKLSHPARGLVFLESEATLPRGEKAALDWYSRSDDDPEGIKDGELLAFAEANFTT